MLDRFPDSVAFSVPFVAFQPRPRMSTRSVPHLYEDKVSIAEKRAIAKAYIEAGGGMFEGPVRVEVCVVAPLPKSRPRSVLAEPYAVKPDLDNVCKKVMDALNGVAYTDDARVTQLVAEKLPRLRGADYETHVCVGPAEERSIDER